MKSQSFVLIHSPLVGKFTWKAVAKQLTASGHEVHIPDLDDKKKSKHPFWKQEVDSIDLTVENPIIVGHSAAGAILPIIGEKLGAIGYIFVDAVLTFESTTRLDLLRLEDSEFAQSIEAYLSGGGKYPDWTDEQLIDMIPSAKIRKKLIKHMHPRDIRFFRETIDIPNNWNHVPCGYIQLTDRYQLYATVARAHQWCVIQHKSHHFALLTEPEKIAKLILKTSKAIL